MAPSRCTWVRTLTLQPTQHPVVTSQGYLLNKEAILSFIPEKEAKKLAEYEHQAMEALYEMRDSV